MFNRPSPLMDAAIKSFGSEASPITSVRKVRKNQYDVETTGSVVRITEYPGGLIGLYGWHKHLQGTTRGASRTPGKRWLTHNYEVLCGVYTPAMAGWHCKLESLSDNQYDHIKGNLPK